MFGIGSILEKGCDMVGLPEVVGDVVGIAADAYSGNWAAVAMAAPDLLENVAPEVAEKLETFERAGGLQLVSAGMKAVDGDYAGMATDLGAVVGNVTAQASADGLLPIDNPQAAALLGNAAGRGAGEAIGALAEAETVEIVPIWKLRDYEVTP